MNTPELKGNRDEQIAKFKQHFSGLADINLMNGEHIKEKMFGKLEMKLKRRVARNYYGERSIFSFA